MNRRKKKKKKKKENSGRFCYYLREIFMTEFEWEIEMSIVEAQEGSSGNNRASGPERCRQLFRKNPQMFLESEEPKLWDKEEGYLYMRQRDCRRILIP